MARVYQGTFPAGVRIPDTSIAKHDKNTQTLKPLIYSQDTAKRHTMVSVLRPSSGGSPTLYILRSMETTSVEVIYSTSIKVITNFHGSRNCFSTEMYRRSTYAPRLPWKLKLASVEVCISLTAPTSMTTSAEVKQLSWIWGTW